MTNSHSHSPARRRRRSHRERRLARQRRTILGSSLAAGTALLVYLIPPAFGLGGSIPPTNIATNPDTAYSGSGLRWYQPTQSPASGGSGGAVADGSLGSGIAGTDSPAADSKVASLG